MAAIHTLLAYVAIARTRREEGATAVEYALLVAGIAVLLVAAIAIFGGDLADFFEGLSTQLGI